MNNLIDNFEQFLIKKDLKFYKFPNKPVIILSVKGKNAKINCITNEIQSCLIFHSEYPVIIPPVKRKSVSELLHRINNGFVLGNFEFDYDKGEISFKTFLDSGSTKISDKAFNKLFTFNIAVLDRNIPIINKVLYCDISPLDALNNKNLIRYRFLVN